MESFLNSYPANEKAVQENLFLQSRVTEAQASAEKNEVNSSGSVADSSSADTAGTQNQSSGRSQAGTEDTSGASQNTGRETDSADSYTGIVDADNDGYDDNTGIYYGTTDTPSYDSYDTTDYYNAADNYDAAGYYDGSTGY